MNVSEVLLKCFDCIFPPSEDALRVRRTSPPDVLKYFLVQDIDDVQALSHYDHIIIRVLIHEAKFHGNTRAVFLLNALFLKYIEDRMGSFDCIIPIPLSSLRMRTRGYNQVYEILRVSGNRMTIPIETKILARIVDTRPQTELSREERLKNLEGAFQVNGSEKITGKRILLVDDVTTTGTTLRMARNALLPYAPVSVTTLALAH